MKTFIRTACLILVAGTAAAQARPPIVAAAEGDSIHVYVIAPPADYRGFVVYGGAAGAQMTRLTETPVRPVRNPMLIGEALQGDLTDILRAASVQDEPALLRKLDSDPMASSVLMVTYPRAAVMLGRRWSVPKTGADTLLSFRVVFTDNTGRETSQSFTTQVNRRDIVAVPPTALAGREESGGIRVTWTYPPYRGGTTDLVIGYRVYRGRGGEMPTRVTEAMILRDTERAPSFLDAGAAAGGPVTYIVRPVDMLGREGAPSAPFTISLPDRTPPAVPGELNATQNRGIVSLTWERSMDPDLRGYHVERARRVNQTYTRITRTLVDGLGPAAYVDSSATGGNQYFYRIVAVDTAGNSRNGNVLSVIVADYAPPTPPADVRATVVGSRRLRISWTPSTAPDVIGYYLYRGEIGSPMTRINSALVTGSLYVDTGPDSAGVRAGGRYRVAVEAVDGGFNVSPQVITEVLVPDDVPPAPASAFGAENVLGRHVRIAWSASASLDVRAYLLERSVDGGAKTLLREIPVTSSRELTDTTVTRGRRYTWSIIAVDSAGNRSTARTDSMRFGDPTPPPSPRNAYARAAAPAGVVVRWERVIDLELAGYVVYRSDLATGTYTKLTPTPIALLEFTDRAGTPESWYTVRAVDRSGNESAASPPVRVPQP